MENCIFCKIVKGDIPAYKIYEDENILAFLDISQTTKGHTLVVPKKHVKNIYELDSETAKLIFSKIPYLSNKLKDALQCTGLNIVNNTNEIAGQSVFHFHIHLIPRYDKTDEFSISYSNNYGKISSEALQNLADKIKKG